MGPLGTSAESEAGGHFPKPPPENEAGARGHQPRGSQGPEDILTIFVVFRSCFLRDMTNPNTAELQKLKTSHVAHVGLLGELGK